MLGQTISVSSSLTHPNLGLHNTGFRKAIPRFIGMVSGLVGRARYVVFDNSIVNANTALLERVFYHAVPGGFAAPSVPLIEVVFRHLQCFRREYISHITKTVPVSLQVYPEQNYRGRRLALYQRARDHVRARCYDAKTFGDLATFIKHEKVLLKDKRLVPRVIQPRSPEYNVCVGRYIRQLEHRIYDIINQMFGGPTVMKGLNCFQQGRAFSQAWSSFSEPCAIMLDAVRFDQHVSAPMLQWEHSLYTAWFDDPYRKQLASYLRLQLCNSGVVRCPDGVLKYKCQGCRASGDMNTALGNVLIMCASIYSLFRKLGVHARLFNNGDDCCIIVEKRHVECIVQAIPTWFASLGFIIEIEPERPEFLEQISFCQTHPVFDGARWRMVRDPNVAISKDVTVIKNWRDVEYRAYMEAIGLCGGAIAGDLPVYGAFYACLSRATTGYRISDGLRRHVSEGIIESGFGYLASGLKPCFSEPTMAARASFALAFGLSPDVQRCLESEYAQFDVGARTLFAGPAVSRLF